MISSPYTSPYLSVDPNTGDVSYNGNNFYIEPGLSIRYENLAVGISSNSLEFTSELRVNCIPNLVIAALKPTYLEVVKYANQTLPLTPILTSSFSTLDSTNCPIVKISLINSDGTDYNDVTCVFLDPSWNLKYAGNVCKKPGLKIKMETSGGGGASATSSIFEAEVRIDCSLHFKMPMLNASYLEITPYANTSVGQTFIAGTGFDTSDPVNCPIKSVQLFTGSNTPYAGTCIVIDASKNLNYNGQFCVESSLKVKLTLTGPVGDVSSDSTVFGAEVRVNCIPHI